MNNLPVEQKRKIAAVDKDEVASKKAKREKEEKDRKKKEAAAEKRRLTNEKKKREKLEKERQDKEDLEQMGSYVK